MERGRPSGFTLLEILLVLLLLSISAVIVVPNLPQNSSDDAKEEAQRFYQLIQLWTEQSLLTGQTFGLNVDKDGYQLLRLTHDDWVPVEKGRSVTSVTLPPALELDLEVSGFVAEEDRLFDRESLFDDELFAEEENQPPQPQVVLMGNGEIIPFTLTFIADNKRLWQVTGNDVATFEVKNLNEDKE
ncbi:type II secretion system minor pseudopilin GspH [Grimontia hollisae]|uniref:Type II secretion system protein H n=1 Tax=Grimontia hollisae TaxID=673 RepID=A0A377HRV5_GRIHO|nr:type II secretion system minor pseudopilin GspH [Grimontia hollisae]MDF2184877.1 type II secretion system minor pseudopilin GspH [Grimontia hollisae]STO58445.1 Cholera toxin secretion protein epsH [Grimontia hollisae]STQ74506.1 Cholera toxin secretion protein epsH [Grimontia hollisae]